jgi:hypothetical protein
VTGRRPTARVMVGVAAAGLWLCLGCSDPEATSSASSGETVVGNDLDRATEHRLWHIAEQTADSMDGSIKSAQAVESQHAAAVRLTSDAIVPGQEAVWAIQIEGVHEFVCRNCPRMAGAPSPRGSFLTVIVDAKTFETTDSGIGSVSVDLGQLGTVIDLNK